MLRNKLEHKTWNKPSSTDIAKFWWGMSIVLSYFVYYETNYPTLPPFTGKLAPLYNFSYYFFGNNAGIVLFAVLTMMTVIAGLWNWMDRNKNQ